MDNWEGVPSVQPERVLQRRTIPLGDHKMEQVLISWDGTAQDDYTWEDY